VKLEPFRALDAAAVYLDRVNVDTDQVLPARYLQKPRSANFGDFLFKDMRAVLEGVDMPKIIVAGRNFGCGSSREHAVWALYDYGFRVAIAPSFGDIFYSNALKNGFLPVVLPEKFVLELIQQKPKQITVDLQGQTAAGQHFDIAPFAKHCLAEGLDEIGYTLTQVGKIAEFERSYTP
jgi:3-isopropylmalate/(R)-2-methylmalate dehydratase small subunit